MKNKLLKRDDLKFVGESIITIGDTTQCLGDLMYFEGHGTFDPDHGRIDGVTREEADIHNKALSQARLEGLDKNCKIGQGSYAYLMKNAEGKWVVQDFIGTVISSEITRTGKSITFRRNGMMFRGQEKGGGNDFNYRRVS